MISPTGVAAVLQRLTRHAPVLALLSGAAMAVPAHAVTQSWNNYKWARTGQLTVRVGDNVSSVWDPYLNTAISQWSTAKNIDFKHAKGLRVTAPLTCLPSYGTVQACSANYGATGWLGYANVWTSGGFIVQATVKLNDYYFSQDRYNTSAWRSLVTCQEIGHTLGLAHNNTITGDANKGTCMDYTNDPSGKLGTNGTLASIAPGASDFTALNGIYANVNGTQLSYTKPAFRAGDGYALDGEHIHELVAVPEPQSWALFIGGFALVGTAMRRRERYAPTRRAVGA